MLSRTVVDVLAVILLSSDTLPCADVLAAVATFISGTAAAVVVKFEFVVGATVAPVAVAAFDTDPLAL